MYQKKNSKALEQNEKGGKNNSEKKPVANSEECQRAKWIHNSSSNLTKFLVNQIPSDSNLNFNFATNDTSPENDIMQYVCRALSNSVIVFWNLALAFSFGQKVEVKSVRFVRQ